MIFHLNLFLSRQKTTTKKPLMWNTMFIGPFMVCEIFAYKLYKNYMKELKIRAKTNKLFKIPLVFYSPRQRVSWSSEADLQYFISWGRGFPGALRLIPSTYCPKQRVSWSSEADPQYLSPEAEGFLEFWGWSPVLYCLRQRVSWSSEADPQYLFPEAEGFLKFWGWSPVLYSPRQRVSWSSEVDLQFLFPEAEGFLELWGWSPVLYCPRQRVSWSSEADPQYFIPRGRGFPGALRLTPSTLRATYLSQALCYPPLIHLQRKLRQAACNQSFVLPVYDHLEKDGTASKSPSLIHMLSSNFQTWPREFNKLSWGHRIQQWWKMERGHATYCLGNLRYLDHLSFSFQSHKIEKLYVYMYGYVCNLREGCSQSYKMEIM